jgi:glycosyltransferase involved in cell wall biosynthesis
MENILVICYSFPPNPGVGGRRWAKFSKYLAQNNYKVHTVYNFNESSKTSEWVDDTIHENIIHYPQKIFYPNIFSSTPKSIFDKLEYRFWLLFFKIVSKGSLYDRAFFWKRKLLEVSKKIIIDHNVKNVIVTGPPFRLFYYSTFLKRDFKHINLILDFRDPWTDNTSFLGFDSLSKKRMLVEKKMEDDSIRIADHIISANDYLSQIFKRRYPELANKFSTIINGFDPDENIYNPIKNDQTNDIRCVLAGSLYPDLEYIFIPLLNFLKDLQINNAALYNRLYFDFYGNIDKNLEQLIKQYNLSCIKIHGFQKLNFVKQKLSDANYCLMFSAPNHSSNFNTKFYEYISLKKTVIHFSNEGAISDFLIKNKLGFAVRPEKFKEDMDKLMTDIEEEKNIYNYNFDSSMFSIKSLTIKIEKLFI